VCKLSAHAFTDQDKLLALISKLHPKTFAEIRSERTWRSQTDNYTDMKGVLQAKVKEDWVQRPKNPVTFALLVFKMDFWLLLRAKHASCPKFLRSKRIDTQKFLELAVPMR